MHDKTTSPASDKHVSLVGFNLALPFIHYVRQYAVRGHELDEKSLRQRWRAAHEAMQELQRNSEEIMQVNTAHFLPLPPEMLSLCDRLLATDAFQQAYIDDSYKIVQVDLRHLIVSQMVVNATFCEQMQPTAPTADTGPADLFAFCFPTDAAVPSFSIRQTARNRFLVTSPSTNLTFINTQTLPPDESAPFLDGCRVETRLGFAFGFVPNLLMAFQIGNRFLLNDGYHRVYALLKNGVEYAPCIVVTLPNAAALDDVLEGDPDEVRRLLSMPRPPVMKDFLDPALTYAFEAYPQQRQVQIKVEIDYLDVPVVS